MKVRKKLIALDVRLRLEDEEVNQHWRRWEPVEDVDSNEIEFKEGWSDFQVALGWIRKNKRPLESWDMYITHYDHLSIIVRFSTGELGVFNNHEYEAFKRDGFICI